MSHKVVFTPHKVVMSECSADGLEARKIASLTVYTKDFDDLPSEQRNYLKVTVED